MFVGYRALINSIDEDGNNLVIQALNKKHLYLARSKRCTETSVGRNFSLIATATITIESEIAFTDLHCCHEAQFIFIHNGEKITISENSVRENLTILKNVLQMALSNELILPRAIVKDIGYLYNKYLQDKLGPSYYVKDSHWWIGDKHNMVEQFCNMDLQW